MIDGLRITAIVLAFLAVGAIDGPTPEDTYWLVGFILTGVAILMAVIANKLEESEYD